jgi:hypothetical protein
MMRGIVKPEHEPLLILLGILLCLILVSSLRQHREQQQDERIKRIEELLALNAYRQGGK